jgi:hypothetical protein
MLELRFWIEFRFGICNNLSIHRCLLLVKERQADDAFFRILEFSNPYFRVEIGFYY